MASAVMIAIGYAGLVTCFGWWGAGFAMAHIGLLLISSR